MIPGTSRSIKVIHEKMYTSLVLLGSTTASQRALAAAQAAELGGKEKALKGFRGFLVTACGIQSENVWYLKSTRSTWAKWIAWTKTYRCGELGSAAAGSGIIDTCFSG